MGIGDDWTTPTVPTDKIISMMTPAGAINMHVGFVPTVPFTIAAGQLYAIVVCK